MRNPFTGFAHRTGHPTWQHGPGRAHGSPLLGVPSRVQAVKGADSGFRAQPGQGSDGLACRALAQGQ
jgi:hypothetical protein